MRTELRHYLLRRPLSELPLTKDLVDNLLARVDYNNDGYINLQEFYALVSCYQYLLTSGSGAVGQKVLHNLTLANLTLPNLTLPNLTLPNLTLPNLT